MNPTKDPSHDTVEFYLFKEPYDKEDFIEQLTTHFSLYKEKPLKISQYFLDTFDYKLHKKGYLLANEGSLYSLLHADGLQTVESVSVKARSKPKFWWDFRECPLREKLSSVIDVRALLPIAGVDRIISKYRLMNEDEKTVLFLVHQEIAAKEGGSSNKAENIISLEPVRGYVEEADSMREYLLGQGLMRSDADLLSIALKTLGKTPGDYSSRINVRLLPGMASSDAVRVILLSLLKNIKINVNGILEDIDIEFLHDYRVAVRRTRSVLTLIKGVFPEAIQKRYKRDFALLGKKTNLLRDLDVYITKRKQYMLMLPEELRPGLDRLFEILQKERQQAHREFVEYVNTAEYSGTINSWEEFLNSPDKEELHGEKADAPVIELALSHIRKRYKKSLKLGAKITDESPDSDLHTLRIECKKLRYFMEFFESLFPEKDIKEAISHLKGLQDNLGEYNDLHVQQETLKSYISKLGSDNESEKEIIASAGGLISQLYRQHRQIRSEFKKRFEDFSSEETTALFEKLFFDL